MTTYQFLGLLSAHWVGDFVLQTDWQAKNKSKDMSALAKHVGSYSVCLLVCAFFIFPGPTLISTLLIFVFLNGALHFVTDHFTSRCGPL